MAPPAPPRPAPLDPRIVLAALWTSTMLIVAFVDIFSMFRADFREQIEAGSVFLFAIDDAFLLGVTLYVGIPSLMVTASVLMPRRVNRLVQIVVAALFALTIVGAAVGERPYYVVASIIELLLLAGVVLTAVRWKPFALAVEAR